MADNQYTYAVARLRSKELLLFSSQTIEQLLAAKSYDECLRLLMDKGWGTGDPTIGAEQLLAAEREKTWDLIGELVEDLSVFDVFLYANDYHNLKAAIKLVCTDASDQGIFISHGTIDPSLILSAVREKDFSLLPEKMREPAEQAYLALSHTHDGQLCDVILDRAALERIHAEKYATKSDLIALYAELTVASADIKTAVRCAITGKSAEFVRRALAPCDTLDVSSLATAAALSVDAICDCLASTDYSAAVTELRQSPSAFERWCDNLMMNRIRPQQFQVFGLGPLTAYILARENEIKSVRIILSGKLNELPEAAIRERVRDMYV